MAYLDELLSQRYYTSPAGADVGLRKGQAYSSFYDPINVSSPAYVTPNAYSLAKGGYNSNEFAYSIMQIRAMAKSQAALRVVDYANDEEIDDHPLTQLLHNPNPAPHMTWQLWSQMKQITQDIAGFSAWEIEYANDWTPLALWYMTPYWCSFLRGQQEPLRAIRYQPEGLQPVDIPFTDEYGRKKIVFFSDGENFDPLTDRVSFRSPLMAAFPQIEVDNAMTFFLKDFVKHGAKFAGLISVAQTIDDAQASDYRRRWRAQHGGAENWSDPLILGQGATYSNMQMNFRDMAFPELDARIESRICNAFNISPIVAGARAGLDVSSYNNVKQAEKDWFYHWVIPSWRGDADAIGTQLLPCYESDPDKYYCEFDFSDVYALQEDRDAQVKRAVELYKARVATRNEARAEIGLDPVDAGDDFAADAPAFGRQLDEEKPEDNKQPIPPKLLQAEQDAKEEEEKKFRKFAKQRVKEGKSAAIPTYAFKYHDTDEQEILLSEFGVIETSYKSDLIMLAEALNKSTDKPVMNITMPEITVHSHLPAQPEAKVTVNVPAPVVNIENSIPVPSVTNVINEQPAIVNVPEKKRGKATVRKMVDGSFEIEDK